jgi:hypothetical protein
VTGSLPAPGDLDGLEDAIALRGSLARELRRAVEDATATPVHIERRLGREWSEGLNATIDELEDFVAQDAVAVLLLAEHALGRLEIADIDDSDGHFTIAFPRLEVLHATACAKAGLGGRELALRLNELAERSGLEAFERAAETHRDPLGPVGLAALAAASG